MYIKQKCGYNYNVYKYKNIKVNMKEGMVVVSLDIQEDRHKKFHNISFFPKQLESTDIEELTIYVGWK